MHQLTSKQELLLNYLKNYIEKHQNAPSFLEIKNYFGFASLSSVYKYLQALKKKGFIQINKSPSRLISLSNVQKKPRIRNYEFPLIGFLTDDGEIEYAEEMKNVPYGSSKKYSSGCFLLKVEGGNFLEAGLLHNDLLIIEPRTEAIPGEAILAKLYNERFAIKKYSPKGAYTRLDSFCIQIEPLLVLNEEVFIHGVILVVIRNYSLV